MFKKEKTQIVYKYISEYDVEKNDMKKIIMIDEDNFVYVDDVRPISDKKVFDNEKDAKYDKLIMCLKNGYEFTDMKKRLNPKDYEYWVNLIKERNPEYLI